jgi:hypothetical protein
MSIVKEKIHELLQIVEDAYVAEVGHPIGT